MRVAVIPPINLLNRYGHATDYHLCLAHLVEESAAYTQHYLACATAGDFVMMDNSVIELGEPVDLKRVLWAAKQVQAHEIILPDVLMDSQATLEKLGHDIELLDFYRQHPDFRNYSFKVQAAPQGSTMQEWMRCLKGMMPYVEEGKIDTIGVPRCTNDLADGNRADILAILHEQFAGSPPFEVHLLGLSNNVTELLHYSEYDWIRGVDSKLPVRCGVNWVGLHPERGLLLTSKIGLPSMDLHEEIDDQPALCYHNIKVMRQMAGDQKAKVIEWAWDR